MYCNTEALVLYWYCIPSKRLLLIILAAYLVIYKIMMRKTTALPDLDWDTPLPEELQKDWKTAIKLLVEQEEVVFDRGTTPVNALGRPELVCYWDGSLLAYAALLYIIERANYNMLVVSMKETVEMMNTKDMSELATFWEKMHLLDQGKVGFGRQIFVGYKLPVLSP